jgi:Zn finger protein HypA/HybF involved in hydrogenase expression
MGSIIKKRCLSCGKEWDHFEGVGFQSAYYYCDKCGKEKVMNISDNPKLEETAGSCKCSGTFRLHPNIVICPFCHCKETESTEDSPIGLWD